MKTLPCIHASETGFYTGVPLTIETEPMRHKDAIIEALKVEVSCVRGEHNQKAIDAMILWLESPHDQEAL